MSGIHARRDALDRRKPRAHRRVQPHVDVPPIGLVIPRRDIRQSLHGANPHRAQLILRRNADFLPPALPLAVPLRHVIGHRTVRRHARNRLPRHRWHPVSVPPCGQTHCDAGQQTDYHHAGDDDGAYTVETITPCRFLRLPLPTHTPNLPHQAHTSVPDAPHRAVATIQISRARTNTHGQYMRALRKRDITRDITQNR